LSGIPSAASSVYTWPTGPGVRAVVGVGIKVAWTADELARVER
jgi:hypothetical protein